MFDFRQKNTSVKELNLANNKIGNEGATAIAKMLEVGYQPILSPIRLLLSYPGLHIVSHAFRASLAAANHVFSFNFLQDNNTLETLILLGNNIGDKAAAALAKALEVLDTCFLWQTLPSTFTLGVMAAVFSLICLGPQSLHLFHAC